MALNMVTINGLLRLPDDVTPQRGKAIFTPGSGLLVDAADNTVLAGSVIVPIADDGTFVPVLPATDNAGTQPLPNTWNWTVRFELYDDAMAPFSFALPSSPATVHFADLVRVLPAPGTYLIVPGPKGDKGDDGGAGEGALLATNNLSDLGDEAAARGHLGLGSAATQASSAFDANGAAGTAQSNAATYTDGKISTEVQRANGAYDALGAAGTAAGTALDLAKTYADTGDGNTLAAAKAYTDAHSGGSASERTVRTRITDDNLSGLPSAPSWVIVLTSAGTPLQCKIKAAVGDRIEVYPNWMREGSHFTDIVILKASDSTIWGYASADGGPTPGSEGNPDMYPALNESYVTSADEFTVVAENIDGSGFVTIGVAHQGTGAGKIFAHTVYPWRMRLKNIGPEPA